MASIISNVEVLRGIHLIWVYAPGLASDARPGQFVMVRCSNGYEPLLRRPLSIHRTDNRERLALLFAVVGEGTAKLSQVKEGDELDLLGPLGNGFSIYHGSSRLLLIAGGIGISPLVFLAEEVLTQGHSVTMLVGASTAAQIYPINLLPPGLESVIATEDGSAGKKGLVTDFLPDFAPRADQLFACGPLSMYQAMATWVPKLKGVPVQVSVEVRMGCGLGACYGCTVKTTNGLKQVCKDGPVFELGEIIWKEINV
jgi:dihydroorotate dehydrogenase electron transfer subunit